MSRAILNPQATRLRISRWDHLWLIRNSVVHVPNKEQINKKRRICKEKVTNSQIKKEKRKCFVLFFFLTEKLQHFPGRGGKKKKENARNSQGESHRLTRKEITGFFFCFKICEKEVTNFIRKKWQIQNEPFKANRVLAFLFPHWKTKINSTIYFVIINLQKMPTVANMIQMNTHMQINISFILKTNRKVQ